MSTSIQSYLRGNWVAVGHLLSNGKLLWRVGDIAGRYSWIDAKNRDAAVRIVDCLVRDAD